MPRLPPRLPAAVACTLALAAGAAAAQAPSTAADAAWQFVGRQGLVAIVIVPADQAADREAYLKQLARVCDPARTCFANFYTNTTGAEARLPLPDAIQAQPTARFRRSMKGGVELLQWSCRIKPGEDGCF